MTPETELYENFPISQVIRTNVLNFSGFILGAILISFLNIWLGIIYFVFCIGTMIWILKARCSHCYYYGKICIAGFGKISSILFKPGSPEKFHQSANYTLPITFIPFLIGLFILFTDFSIGFLGLLILYLLSFLIRMIISKLAPEQVSCNHCKQRSNCKMGLAMSK